MNKTKKLLMIFSIILAILLISTIISTVKYYTCKEITGKVTYVKTVKKSKEKLTTVIYTVDNKEYTEIIHLSRYSKVKVGDSIEFRANTDNPQKIMVLNDFVGFYVADVIIAPCFIAIYRIYKKERLDNL